MVMPPPRIAISNLPGKTERDGNKLCVDISGGRVVIARFHIELVTFVVDPDRESGSPIYSERRGSRADQRLVLGDESVGAGVSPPRPRRTANYAGADDYFVKPFAWEELLARVRSLVRCGHGQFFFFNDTATTEIYTVRRPPVLREDPPT